MIDECTLHMFSATRLVWYVHTYAGGGGGGGMYLHTAINSWKVYNIHIHSRVDASFRNVGGDMEDDDRHMPQRYARVQWSVQSPWKTKPSILQTIQKYCQPFIPVYRRANGVAQRMPH